MLTSTVGLLALLLTGGAIIANGRARALAIVGALVGAIVVLSGAAR